MKRVAVLVLAARGADDVHQPRLDALERCRDGALVAHEGVLLAQHDEVGGRLVQEPLDGAPVAERDVDDDRLAACRLHGAACLRQVPGR